MLAGINHAQKPADRVALVIGNGAYKSSPLGNPVNDATDVAASLRKLGFNVILRTNVNRVQMRSALRDFSEALKRGQVGLFYYAGHGVESKGKNFLIPLAANMENEFELEDEAVDANTVLRAMEDAGNATNIMILDACRDNPFARSWRSTARGLAQMNAPTGSFIAFATAPGSIASDGGGRNGTFTKHLLASLNQPDLDIDRVFTRVTAAVAQETGKKQVPWKSSSLTGAFSFGAGQQVASVIPQPVVVDPLAGDRALWEAVKDSKDVNEIRAYLDQFPKGLFAGVANVRLKALSAPVTPPVQVALAPPPPVVSTPPTIPGATFKDCSDCPEMVVIPAGAFLMGSNADPFASSQPSTIEQPQHQVRIKSFAIGKYEVTQEQWFSIMGNLPSNFKGRTLPVEQVSWDDAQAFVRKLSEKTGKNYRLPSEAEWEYAARAGSQTNYYFGDNENESGRYTWSYSNSGNTTHPVGEKLPNAFGLYDMLGNVWEWTADCWNGNYNGAPNDGSAWTSGSCGQRVLRGGSWFNDPQFTRSANRFWLDSTLRFNFNGFRLARMLP